jgi:hypothetical protein
MKVISVQHLNDKFEECDITTATQNFYVKAGDAWLLIHNSPALIAGWLDGEFMLTDKAGFSAKGYNGLTTSAQALKDMIRNRKIKLDTPEAQQARVNYANKIASLYPLLKQVIPSSVQGFVQGDLLWTGTPAQKDGNFVFQPNKIEYKVPVMSELGEQIGRSKVGIVFHSKLASTQDEEPDALRDPSELGIHSTSDVVVMPHEMQFSKPFKLNTVIKKKIEQLVRTHGAQIDDFLNPSQLSELQIKSLPNVMKAFLAHKAGEGDADLSDASSDFLTYLQIPKSKVSPKAQQNILTWIKSHVQAFNAIWQIVSLIQQLKLDLKAQMDTGVGDKVQAHLSNQPGHEGFVSVTDAGTIKLVNRAQFMKKTPSDTLTEAKTTTTDTPHRVVFTFGRMNPPTLGHKKVVQKVAQVAGNDDYWVFLSHSQDVKKNPLDWSTKLHFAGEMMQHHKSHLASGSQFEKVKTPLLAMDWLYAQGYRDINMVVGSDRVAAMTDVLNGWNSEQIRSKYNRDPVQIKVISAGERDPDAEGVEGVSASMVRALAQKGDFTKFKAAVGLDHTFAKQLYQAVRAGMKLDATLDDKKISEQQLQEVAPLVVMALGAAGRALASAAPRVLPNVGKALGLMARNPVKTTVAGTAAANPSTTVDVVSGTVNFIKNPAEAVKQMISNIMYSGEEMAVSGIKAITGNSLSDQAVKALAQFAVSYSLPAAAVIAILYGGKKLYDYFTKDPPPELQKAAQQVKEAQMRLQNKSYRPTQLQEDDDQHPHGTLVKVMMDKASAKKLYEWCKQHNIECMEPSYLHSTLIYSLKPAPQLVALHNTQTHMVARIKGWAMLGDNVLTLKLDCPIMNQMHEKFKQQGATHTYPNFIPHTTVMWNWNKPIPAEFPDMQLVYDKLKVTAIKPRAS